MPCVSVNSFPSLFLPPPPFPCLWSIVISMVLIAGIRIYHLFKTTLDVTNICKSNNLNNKQKNCVSPCTTHPQMKFLFYSCLVRAAKLQPALQVKIGNRVDISSLTFLVNLITEWINFSLLKYFRCISVNFKAFYCLWFILTLRKLSIVCRKLLFTLKYIEVLPEKNCHEVILSSQSSRIRWFHGMKYI